jgi:hypothetical protein
MHGSQTASPVVSGDYDGAGCCVLVRVRLRAYWGRRPVVESQTAIDGHMSRYGQADETGTSTTLSRLSPRFAKLPPCAMSPHLSSDAGCLLD